MDVFLDPELKRGAAKALFEQLADGICTGRLAEGDRLPPTRELADQLGVARSTVTTVYSRLAAEGYIEGRAGGGSYVSSFTTRPVRRRQPTTLVPRSLPLPPADDAGDPPAPRFDLRHGTPDLRLFPLAAWRQCVTAAVQVPPPGYGHAAGLPQVRRTLLQWLGRSRAVEAHPDQVLVTAGTQQAVDLVLRVLVAPGEVVAVEDPGYRPIRQLAALMGLIVVPVPVDREGIVVDAIPRKAKVVYTTPSHQSPTGATMSLAQRRALLAFADRNGTAIIEDDYDSEYRYVDRPLEPLQRLDRTGRVIYVGTFSKTLAPSLRFGYLVLPESLVPAVVGLRKLIDYQPPAVTQYAMARFIADGHLDRHLRRTRKVYAERHALVATFLSEHRDLVSEVATSLAGLHVAVHLGEGITEVGVKAAGAPLGLALGDFGPCFLNGDGPEGLVIGYSSIATQDLPDALSTLTDVLRSEQRAGGLRS